LRTITKKRTVFRYVALDEDGTGDIFETDQAKTVLPTHRFTSAQYPHKRVKSGKINRVHYRLNPTNAETYQLRIWARAVNGAATPYEQEVALLYESPAAQADDQPYEDVEMDIPFTLHTAGYIYYSIDWTGAPGNTPGMIEVEGECDP